MTRLSWIPLSLTNLVFQVDLHSFPTRRSSDLRSGSTRRWRPRRLAATGPEQADRPVARSRSLSISHRPIRDRKSTRLNSSHVSNSYAVFCWKKKHVEIVSDSDKNYECHNVPLL